MHIEFTKAESKQVHEQAQEHQQELQRITKECTRTVSEFKRQTENIRKQEHDFLAQTRETVQTTKAETKRYTELEIQEIMKQAIATEHQKFLAAINADSEKCTVQMTNELMKQMNLNLKKVEDKVRTYATKTVTSIRAEADAASSLAGQRPAQAASSTCWQSGTTRSQTRYLHARCALLLCGCPALLRLRA